MSCESRVDKITLMPGKLKGGILVFIGYILSPLSWWNDPFINIPISYFFASISGFISEKLFTPTLIAVYWMTNILGFVLLHKGATSVISKPEKQYIKNDFYKDIVISVFYTFLIVILIYTGIIKKPAQLFK